MSDCIPQEVLIDILARLPLKTILQCRCVSRAWCSLISSPPFITHHLKQTTTKNTDLLLFRYCSRDSDGVKEHFFLYPDEGFPDYHIEELDCPFKSIGGYYTNIVGSCDGVFCLSDDAFCYTDGPVLWNPSIRKAVAIPKPNVSFSSHGPFTHSLGFGFDSVTNDYKLVRIVYLVGCGVGFGMVPPLVEVYSLRSGCWKMVTNDVRYVIWEHSSSAFVNGACHWIGYDPLKRYNASHVIVSFALGNEEFGEMAVPDCLVSDDCINMTVAVFDGLLSLVPCKKWFRDGCYGSVWVMKEYGVGESWTKLFNVDHLEWIERLVAFRKSNKVLLTGEYGELIAYDPKTNESWDCKICGDADAFYLDTFVESLVLLGEANGVFLENAFGSEEEEEEVEEEREKVHGGSSNTG